MSALRPSSNPRDPLAGTDSILASAPTRVDASVSGAAVAKKIVIAVDADGRARDALALGRAFKGVGDADIVLMTWCATGRLRSAVGPQTQHPLDAPCASLLRQAALEGLAVSEARAIASNVAARELRRVSAQPHVGLIIVGAPPPAPLVRLPAGEIGERLLVGARCPVAIAPANYADRRSSRLRTIGVGYDGSSEARRALDAAIDIAKASGARIHVITAVQRLAFGGVRATALTGRSANDVLRMQLRRSHDEAIAHARRHVESGGRIIDGLADDVLAAESSAVDLLVLGVQGRGRFATMFAGSVTRTLARSAACPILVAP